MLHKIINVICTLNAFVMQKNVRSTVKYCTTQAEKHNIDSIYGIWKTSWYGSI